MCIKEIKNKDILYNTWNYIQYLTTIRNGKESENVCALTYINHFAIYLKHNTVNNYSSLKKKKIEALKSFYRMLSSNSIILGIKTDKF